MEELRIHNMPQEKARSASKKKQSNGRLFTPFPQHPRLSALRDSSDGQGGKGVGPPRLHLSTGPCIESKIEIGNSIQERRAKPEFGLVRPKRLETIGLEVE